MTKILLSTGGTGGHIFPILGLYSKLRKIEEIKDIKIITDERAKKFIKSENIKIGKIIPNAWFKGITIVINGIDIKVIDPPKPDFAIPYKIIAGTTVKKNNKFISIYSMNLIVLILKDLWVLEELFLFQFFVSLNLTKPSVVFSFL